MSCYIVGRWRQENGIHHKTPAPVSYLQHTGIQPGAAAEITNNTQQRTGLHVPLEPFTRARSLAQITHVYTILGV